ncbi:uncharacterized protein [Cicer arietinum]|uniref:uncharacterized protein n=1 Tax=Cicer arietinum TaxID=3827 RepID=UPI003CC52563
MDFVDDLYDYYSSESNTAKQVWDALKKKYDTEEAGAKKYVVSHYLKYQMTDGRSVKAQSHEIQKIAHKIISKGMSQNEQIEEESRKQDQKDEILLVANNKKKKFIGAVLKPNDKQLKNQNRTSKNNNKNGNPPKVPIVRQQPTPRNGHLHFLCFYCGKYGHMARKCKNKSSAANPANLTEEKFIAMITEINLVGGLDGWWIDTDASHHVYKKVLLGDSHTTNVAGIGDVKLIFTFGKTLIMKDVMHTPEIRKNLVSGFILNKAGFTQSIGAYLYTISKNGIFVGKGYIDADWNTLPDDSKATNGYVFSIAGGDVSWKSKKHTILVQSTMESEMIVLATASE